MIGGEVNDAMYARKPHHEMCGDPLGCHPDCPDYLARRAAKAVSVPNPKDVIGNTKLPLNLVPPTAIAHMSLALLDGATKYGYWNWRASGINASVYVDAALRHLEKWNSGEDLDADSGLSHLAHALATIAIIIDAAACGKLTDDRAPIMDIGAYFDKLTPEVARIKLKNAGKNPRHFTLADVIDFSKQRTLLGK